MIHRDSDDDQKETAALRLYMDESGGNDPNTPQAVIGGMLINKNAFTLFEAAWEQMLSNHGIPSGIHMKEFGRHGRLGNISVCCRRKLAEEAKYLIEHYRAMTITASIDNSEYISLVPEAAREKFSLYGMCFHLAVMMNHKLCEHYDYPDRVPFIMDTGNPHASHVREAHDFMIKRQKITYLHAGGLFFDDDEVFGVLQAADIIAWSERRRLHNKPFPAGFEPFGEMISRTKTTHIGVNYSPDLLKQLGDSLQLLIDQGDDLTEITDEDISGI